MAAAPRPCVFVPPWSIVHSRVYKAQLPYFSERFRCVTYDGRGNGQSDRPDDVAAYTLDNYVADALAVMDATRTGPAIIAGLSLGAMIACVLAAYHPERVKAADPGRHGGRHRARLSLHGGQIIFVAQALGFRGLGQVQSTTTGSRTIPTLPRTSSATSFPSHIRPSRSRTALAWACDTTGANPRPDGATPGRCRRLSTSARRCTARSNVRSW